MRIWDRLIEVQKPARYIGEEWNIIKKDWDKTEIKFLICYPDTYEIGMSNLGIAIIYDLLNKREDVLCERCFAPWRDMEKLLRELGEPLFSLESKKPINQFDVIGFSLQHELNYTNILTILELGEIKIWQAERGKGDPIVMGGGPSTLNPEPVADFFDLFFIGEAEVGLLHIIDLIKDYKRGKISRSKFLELAQDLEGVYVPSLHKLEKSKGGFLVPKLDFKVKKVTVQDLNQAPYPVKPIVPYVQTIHDRINLEIMRGCPKFCRFCQARIFYGPRRYRSVGRMLQIAEESYINTGHEELCLLSLSSGDYPYILELIDSLRGRFRDKHLFISLPSLWIGENTIDVLSRFLDSKRPALTFAPEVSSGRMKGIIGKATDEEKLIEVVNFALNKGWKKVKLYYMLGLPGLGLKDLEEMRQFLFRLLNLNTKRKVQLRLSFATFIPKPHTPFQWEEFKDEDIVEEQIGFVKGKLRRAGIFWEIRDYKFSLIEAVLSRGDRRLGRVIFEAWRMGARFDSWEGEFNYDLWYNAFRKCGIEYQIYIRTEGKEDTVYPWDFIDTGVDKKLLWKSYLVAKEHMKV